jgi:hypothetical protein
MTEHDQPDPDLEAEREDDPRGAHNRLGYLNVDESDTSSERGGEEPEVEEEVDQPERRPT